MNGPRIGSLCSGYGGLDMGVVQVLGGEVVWHAEYDDAPAKVLVAHWPGVPNLRDITKVDWTQVEPVDVICGGTPCQDLSAAGKRAGMTEGTRSNLWVQMREAVATLRPSLVIWENVRGAYSARAASDMELAPRPVGGRPGGPVLRALGRVLGDLAELGYDAAWGCVRASDAGAPHGRARVFVVAADTRRDECRERSWVDRSLAGPQVTRVGEGTERERDRHAVGDRGATVADARGVRRDAGWPAAPGEAQGWRPLGLASGRDARPTPDTEDDGRAPLVASGPCEERAWPEGGRRPAPDTISGGCVGRSPDAKWGPVERVAPTRRREGTHVLADTDSDGCESVGRVDTVGRDADRRGREDVAWGAYEPAVRRWEHVIGRPAPRPTEPGARGGERLSPRFSEWMMGLPDGHITAIPGLTRNEKLKVLGNGVVPQQAALALRTLLPFLATEVAA